mmetsp:Transcript_53727/g.96216  ORF Transcript_53727/g.96216 Transcript_53727/m.96216 type:complete len:269 (-) Transcript_53727:2649-3455(-)
MHQLWGAPTAGSCQRDSAPGQQGAHSFQFRHRSGELPGRRGIAGLVDLTDERSCGTRFLHHSHRKFQAAGGETVQLQCRLQHQAKEGAGRAQRERHWLQDPRFPGHRGAWRSPHHQLWRHGDFGHGHAASARAAGCHTLPQERQQEELQLPSSDACWSQPSPQAHRRLREASILGNFKHAGSGRASRGDTHRVQVRSSRCSYARGQHSSGGNSCGSCRGNLQHCSYGWSEEVSCGVLFPQSRLWSLLHRQRRCHDGWRALCTIRGHAV